MAKVLVTGASGFIGTHLVSALAERGDEVTCLVRRTSRVEPLREAGARFVYGDVTDRASIVPAVQGQQIVYHVAGCTAALAARKFYYVNQRGVANIAQACAGQTTPPILITVSSLAAAGPSHDGAPMTERHPSRPVSHYGHSKRAGERAAEHFADRVPITIVRPPIVVGERDRLALPLFRSVARFGVHLVPGLDQRRFSLIHADDLVQLLILAAERGKRLPPRGSPNRTGRRAITSPPAKRIPPMPISAGWWPSRSGHHSSSLFPPSRRWSGWWLWRARPYAHPPRSAIHQPRQSPRNHRRTLALFGRGGERGFGFRRRRPAVRAVAADRPVVS